ncbi:acid-sensing ion channel 1C-like [Acanthaster planci]|uniref:Acid-sensing ion channel 1C-like n=1 Tax=Acanthaster planci TaxID=133434 RepID=A0A8B7Z8R2_ACAPL|nr:acid-sensing ion channel 1C-like [Acanthaster planci]
MNRPCDGTDHNFGMETDDLRDGRERRRPSVTRRKRGFKRKKSKDTCKNILAARIQQFGDDTTFHGLRYVTNSTYHTFRRFVWLLVVTGMTALLIFDIIRAIMLMFEYPEMSSISVQYPPNITFPALTLCNINMLRKDALDASEVQLLSDIFANPATPPDTDALVDSKLFNSSSNEELMGRMIDASYRIEDMLVKCRWVSETCSYRNFTRSITDHGVCYTFNDPLSDHEALIVRHPGSRHGLFMRLNVQQYLYTYGESTAAGLKVLLHAQGEYPMIKDFAFSLSPGFETSIVVRQKVMINQKAPYKSNCTDGNWGRHRFKYSAASCKYACKILYVTRKCGCRDYRWSIRDIPICSLEKQVQCIYRYEDEFVLSQENQCHCPIACKAITYGREISQAYWPASFLSKELQAEMNVTEDFIRENYLDVYIYYDEIMYTRIEQIGAYTVDNLQSDIGGYLGLLCGMSLMTVVELLDFILVALCSRLKR